MRMLLIDIKTLLIVVAIEVVFVIGLIYFLINHFE